METRHARILPSFAVALAKRDFSCGLGTVKPQSLLAWSGPLPTQTTTEEIRYQFVKRNRVNPMPLMSQSTGIKLRDGWKNAIDASDVIRVEMALTHIGGEQNFPVTSLEVIKQGMRLPLVKVLAILAKIEASYWITGREAGIDVSVTPEWKTQVFRVFQQQWVKDLDSQDLRFPRPSGLTLEDCLANELSRPEISYECFELCNRLVAADKATWSEELRALSEIAIQVSSRKPGSNGHAKRWVDIFLMRYGGTDGQTLKSVGDSLGMTRERIRQICDTQITALTEYPVAMPALSKVLAAAAELSPMVPQLMNNHLAHLLGNGGGVVAALAFAKEVGMDGKAQLIKKKEPTYWPRTSSNGAVGFKRIS
ncbi:sigma factor-like helix-turn-helix DNA-binding protein [Comamonas sp. w2-DMI]|uniref:sigma factor-like helix-turn-helix DNA-binding protein n=1 Tax=Comamonas sp. w2-DMI TaxID=3126391 RepID=UPI0032E4E2BC